MSRDILVEKNLPHIYMSFDVEESYFSNERIIKDVTI